MEESTRKKIKELIGEYVDEMDDDRLEAALVFVQDKKLDNKEEGEKKNAFADKVKSML